MSGFGQSAAPSCVKGIAGNAGVDDKTKGFLPAALACCGNASHGRGYAPAGVADNPGFPA